MFLDRFFAQNTRRKSSAARGNYAFRSRRGRVRLEVHRLDLNPETAATLREKRRKVMRWGVKFAVACLFCPQLRLAANVPGSGCLVDTDGFALPSGEITAEQAKLPTIRVEKLSRLAPGQCVESPELHAALKLLRAHESSDLAHSMD